MASDRDRSILCVDLDGTLVRSDLLFESICLLFKAAPHKVLLFPVWLLKGRGYLKRRIAERVSMDAATLPYNTEFLEYLREQHKLGRKIVLATASDSLLAERVAEHLGIFEEVWGSNQEHNLVGRAKLKHLQERYGEGNFDYAGNEKRDIPIWQASNEAILVGSTKNCFEDEHQQPITFKRVFPGSVASWKPLLKALRIHQWVKNVLVFAPLLLSHRVGEGRLFVEALTAFFSFSFVASGIYVLNDLLDLEADRQHATKQRRPFACGDLPLYVGFALVPLLLLLGGVIGYYLSSLFFVALCLYATLTFSYSLLLKQIVLLDILVLASLYTLRIIAGGYAVDVEVSQWFLAFSMFLFLSLACVKRYSELFGLRLSNKVEAKGRGYLATDLEQIAQFGTAGAYIAVLVLALYISSLEVAKLYSHPQILWLECPLLLYWVSRVWLLAHRGALHEDPIVFAITDIVSYIVGALAIIVMVFAS